MTLDPYAPVIPCLMARLAAIQRGEREHARSKERRLEKELRPAQHAGKSGASAKARGGDVRAVAREKT